MVRKRTRNTRVSDEFLKLLNEIRIEFIKKGKTPPTAKEITSIIAKSIKKEEILFDKAIRF